MESSAFDRTRQGGADNRPHLKRKRRPPGASRTSSKTLTIPDSTLVKLAAFCSSPQAEGKSESWVVGDAIEEYIANRRRRTARA